MYEKYYFDTSIWLDFFEKRGINGENAFRLIKKIIKNNSKVFYSELNIKELKHIGYSFEKVKNMFEPIKNIIRRVHIYKEDIELAKRIASQRKIPKGDALHAILARNNETNLISRDAHFQKLKDITTAKKPEELT